MMTCSLDKVLKVFAHAADTNWVLWNILSEVFIIRIMNDRLWIRKLDFIFDESIKNGYAHFTFDIFTNLATRHKLVAIDAVTGTLDPWNPGANSPLGVFGMASDGGSLEVGGDFTKIGTPNASHGATKNQQGYAQFSPA